MAYSYNESLRGSIAAEVLPTVIAGAAEREVIESALNAYIEGLDGFTFPKELGNSPYLGVLVGMQPFVERRQKAVIPLAVEVIGEINERAILLRGDEYADLVTGERSQWALGNALMMVFGGRWCADAGVTREEVVGSDGHMGRSLAGDDDVVWVPEKNRFAFAPSTLVKRLIHGGRMGHKVALEILGEHTICGRRGQQLANRGADNEIAQPLNMVFDHLDALASEFAASPGVVNQLIDSMMELWGRQDAFGRPLFSNDGGILVGIWMKIAQRQSFRNLSKEMVFVNPIELCDKRDGNLLVGLDQPEVLGDTRALRVGGFTDEVLHELVKKGTVFSLRDEVGYLNELLEYELPVACGQRSFEELQTTWLDVKRDFVRVTGRLWQLYESEGEVGVGIQNMAGRFLKLSLSQLGDDLKRVERMADTTGVTVEALKRRLIHQLFRALAYTWVLDTFSRGNPPGEHIEAYLATGDRAVLGTKKYLALGQGDMRPPSADEIFTGRSVLLHSTSIEEDEPILVLMKLDTDRDDDQPMTTEETQRALDDFREMLRLWPYFAVGDMVPVMAVIGKGHGGVSRVARSVVETFGDILNCAAAGILPEMVSATNSRGEVILVRGVDILELGRKAGGDLGLFRRLVTKLADVVSDPASAVDRED